MYSSQLNPYTGIHGTPAHLGDAIPPATRCADFIAGLSRFPRDALCQSQPFPYPLQSVVDTYARTLTERIFNGQTPHWLKQCCIDMEGNSCLFNEDHRVSEIGVCIIFPPNPPFTQVQTFYFQSQDPNLRSTLFIGVPPDYYNMYGGYTTSSTPTPGLHRFSYSV